MNPLCFIGLHYWTSALVESKLPKPNYKSHSNPQWSTVDLEEREGRKCRWCKKEQVWHLWNRWLDGKYINAIK